MEDRTVTALGQFDFDQVAASVALVILTEFVPQSPRLGSDDRVNPWVERFGFMKDFDAEQVFLQLPAVPRALLVYDKAEEARELRGIGEGRAGENRFQFVRDCVASWFRGSCLARLAGWLS